MLSDEFLAFAVYPVTIDSVMKTSGKASAVTDGYIWAKYPSNSYTTPYLMRCSEGISRIYTYVHNLQGDILGIVDAAGSLVVEYMYDAWVSALKSSLPLTVQNWKDSIPSPIISRSLKNGKSLAIFSMNRQKESV